VVVEAVPRGLFRAERARDGSVLTQEKMDDVTQGNPVVSYIFWTLRVVNTLGRYARCCR
jgi:hypothetical protein